MRLPHLCSDAAPNAVCSEFQTRNSVDRHFPRALEGSWAMILRADGRSTAGSLSWRTHWALGLTLAGKFHSAHWRRDCLGRLILDAMLSKVVSHHEMMDTLIRITSANR